MQTVFTHTEVLAPLVAPTDKEARPYLRPIDCLNAAHLIAAKEEPNEYSDGTDVS